MDLPHPPTQFDLKQIDLNLLLIFDAIYTTKSISQAAVQLSMSQPTVSNSLARLRGQLNDPLFTRSDRGVAPTIFADNLITPIRNALAILRDGFQPARSFDVQSAERTFKIALHSFTATSLLPPLLDDIYQRAPGIKIEFFTQDTSQPFDALLSGKIDLAIDVFPRDDKEIHIAPLFNVQVVAIARRSHPLIKGKLSPELFSTVGHVTLILPTRGRVTTEATLLAAGVKRRVVCEVANSGDMAPLVARTDLIAVVPLRHAMSVADLHDLQIMPLPFEYPAQKTFMGWHRQNENDVGLTWLRMRLKEIAIASEPNFPLPHA